MRKSRLLPKMLFMNFLTSYKVETDIEIGDTSSKSSWLMISSTWSLVFFLKIYTGLKIVYCPFTKLQHHSLCGKRHVTNFMKSFIDFIYRRLYSIYICFPLIIWQENVKYYASTNNCELHMFRCLSVGV